MSRRFWNDVKDFVTDKECLRAVGCGLAFSLTVVRRLSQ